jgi:thiamine biosynthesis lipoprotein
MIDTSTLPKDVHRFSHKAMATIFEIFIYSKDRTYASQAATAAFIETDRLEQELSYFIESSDVSRINKLLKNDIITVGIDAFECIKKCMKIYQQTKGAFDITMRPLFELWKKYNYPRKQPDKILLTQVMNKTGLPWLQIDDKSHQVSLMSESIQIDLGGFGKGYALDVLKEYLDDWDLESGLIHSGHSTVSVFGKNPAAISWPLSISDPLNSEQILKKVVLKQGSLSGSGLKKGEHIIDPRSGTPVRERVAAWAYTRSAGDADAFSTALMVMEDEEIASFCDTYKISALTIKNDAEKTRQFYGEWDEK